MQWSSVSEEGCVPVGSAAHPGLHVPSQRKAGREGRARRQRFLTCVSQVLSARVMAEEGHSTKELSRRHSSLRKPFKVQTNLLRAAARETPTPRR